MAIVNIPPLGEEGAVAQATAPSHFWRTPIDNIRNKKSLAWFGLVPFFLFLILFLLIPAISVFAQALHDKRGMERYGFTLPMDDCLAQVAIDFGGRNWLVWEADFKREKIGDMPTEMFIHFFKSFTDTAKCNLNIKAEGTNEHHKIESIFKAFFANG